MSEQPTDVLGKLIAEAKLEAVRAFVERVEARARVFNSNVAFAIWGALQDELAAMEKENESSS